MSTEVDGAEYLRRLKQDECSPQSKPSTPTCGKRVDVAERRATPRYKCQGSVKVRVQGSDVSAWGSIADISLHGCYVEMANTHAVGTAVNLTLEVGGNRVEVNGEVRATYPFLGMGIIFKQMTPQDRLRLGDMVLIAARDLRLIVPHAENTAFNWQMPKISDPLRLIEALENFFVRRHSMSRDEFTRLASGLSSGG